MSLSRGRQIKDEEHPCQCHDSYVEWEDEETVHIKRDYFEHIVWFWCRNCECHWNKVTYLVGKHAWIEIVQEPYSKEEE